MNRRKLHSIHLKGFKSTLGTDFVRVSHALGQALIPYDLLIADPKAAFAWLSEQGVPPPAGGFVAELLDDLQELRGFEDAEILEESGHSGKLFGFPNGDIAIPERAQVDGAQETFVGYFRMPGRNAACGKLKGWKKAAAILAADDFSLLIMGAVLAPPLARLISPPVEPFAMQFLSPARHDNLRGVAMSAFGSVDKRELRTDTLSDVTANPERYGAASRDYPLIVGKVAAYLDVTGDKKRIAEVRKLLLDHLIASGNTALTSRGKPAPVALFFEPESIEQLLDLEPVVAERIRRNLITLQAPEDVFMTPIDEYDDRPRRSLWDASRHGLAENYGWALRTFVEELVERRGQDRKGFDAEIKKKFGRFAKEASKVTKGDRAAEHLIAPFALIYAAIRLAREFEILPKDEGTGPQVGRMFKLARGSVAALPTAAEVVQEIAARSDTVDIDEISEDATVADLEEAPAFIKTYKGSRRELWVTTEQKKHVFDWPMFSALPDLDDVYVRGSEKDRDGGRRNIGSMKGARILRFRLPD